MGSQKKIAILGSTGSIGRNSLKIIESFPGKFEIVGLAAGCNYPVLAEQANRHRPPFLAMSDEEAAAKLRHRLDYSPIEIRVGDEGVLSLVMLDGLEMVVSAIVGSAGLVPTYQAVRRGVNIALANKEPMVMAGGLILQEAEKTGASIIPVDSEHHAIFTTLKGLKMEEVSKVTLTASGGPFINWTKERLEQAKIQEALQHPSWSMGDKITIDSATLMNKGLEIIEAHWLFGLDEEKIDVIVHPQSVIHAMVHLVDGGILAYLSNPDMRLPIAAALHYPEKHETGVTKVDLAGLGRLTFLPPDHERFPSLKIAREALRSGGTAPTVMNAANEVAVQAFLDERIGFNSIFQVIKKTLEVHQWRPADRLETVIEEDRWAKKTAEDIIGRSIISFSEEVN